MKRAFLLLMSIVIVASLAACGSKSGDSTATDGSTDSSSATTTTSTDTGTAAPGVVTIKTNLAANEISDDQIKAFEKDNPNIKIVREDADAAKLAAELATGDAPDLIRVQGVTELSSYVIKGIAMDLTDKLDHSEALKLDDMLPVVDVYRFDGKTVGQGPIYGLPKDWSPDYTIFYNKKLFDAAGVAVPSADTPLTWTQVIDLAKKLTIKKGGKVQQYGLTLYDDAKTEAEYPMLIQYLASKGVDISAADFSSINFDNPAVKEYLNLWNDAVQSDVGPNSVNNDATAGMTQFLDEKAAMIVSGYWFSGLVRVSDKPKTHLNDFGMLPAPMAEGGTRISPTGGATGCIINKNTKHPNEAWKVFEWFFGGQPAQDRAKSGWGVPISKSMMSLMPQDTDFDKRVYASLQKELQYTNSYLKVNPYLTNPDALIQKYMTPVYFKKSTIDDAVKGITKDADVIISESQSAVSN